MKKILIIFTLVLSIENLNPACAENLNYRIKQEGNTMVIVPYYSTPSIQKPLYEVEKTPTKIPIYTKNLPKCKNRNKSV